MPDHARRHATTAAVSALALLLAACASAGGGLPSPGPIPGGVLSGTPAGVPGFDTRRYPGDSAMAVWRSASPYRWVGYYLTAPCYTGTSWQGKREALQTMGWGMAVLFLGEQDWAAGAGPAPGEGPPRCTRTNLTPERGRADGGAAVQAAAAEGFAPGTVLYLDVERTDSVSAALESYVRSWTEAVLADGRYLPGLYAHGRNAPALHDLMSGSFAAAGRASRPRLWVASAQGFDLLLAPDASGYPGASVWQGAFDVDETWGGVTLRVDRDVADSGSPSG